MRSLPDGFILALEGVLVAGNVSIEGSVEAIVRLRAMGRPFRIVAEGILSSPDAVAEGLCASGFSIDPEEIRLAKPGIEDNWSGTQPELITTPRHALLALAAADMALADGAQILVVGDDFDAEIRPALDLGFQGLLVRSGDPVDEARVGSDIPSSQVATNFGAWLYQVLRLR